MTLREEIEKLRDECQEKAESWHRASAVHFDRDDTRSFVLADTRRLQWESITGKLARILEETKE